MRILEEEKLLAMFAQESRAFLERIQRACLEVNARMKRLEKDSKRYLEETRGDFSAEELSRILEAHALWETKRSLLTLRMEGSRIPSEERESLVLQTILVRHALGKPFKPQEAELLRRAAASTENSQELSQALAKLGALDVEGEEKAEKAGPESYEVRLRVG